MGIMNLKLYCSGCATSFEELDNQSYIYKGTMYCAVCHYEAVVRDYLANKTPEERKKFKEEMKTFEQTYDIKVLLEKQFKEGLKE